ncbi:Uncharacterized protein ToN1_31620 [Aromatoleum petrolei]|nr:Uncharacterized protein ToN1_31620 [Aromatoleum petrolei]
MHASHRAHHFGALRQHSPSRAGLRARFSISGSGAFTAAPTSHTRVCGTRACPYGTMRDKAELTHGTDTAYIHPIGSFPPPTTAFASFHQE